MWSLSEPGLRVSVLSLLPGDLGQNELHRASRPQGQGAGEGTRRFKCKCAVQPGVGSSWPSSLVTSEYCAECLAFSLTHNK